MPADVADRLFGGPNAETIASASLESMRAQNRLTTFVARYVSVTSSKTSRFGFSTERTLILPGDVRYEVDLAKLQPKDVVWDKSSNTLSVLLPEIEIAGPEVDLAAAREYGEGGVLAALTNSDQQLDQANRDAAVADLRKQAQATVPMRLARDADARGGRAQLCDAAARGGVRGRQGRRALPHRRHRRRLADHRLGPL